MALADDLRELLRKIDLGELTSSVSTRNRIEGALTALSVVLGQIDNPLDITSDPLL